jgi:hypothetical protein
MIEIGDIVGTKLCYQAGFPHSSNGPLRAEQRKSAGIIETVQSPYHAVTQWPDTCKLS